MKERLVNKFRNYCSCYVILFQCVLVCSPSNFGESKFENLIPRNSLEFRLYLHKCGDPAGPDNSNAHVAVCKPCTILHLTKFQIPR